MVVVCGLDVLRCCLIVVCSVGGFGDGLRLYCCGFGIVGCEFSGAGLVWIAV